MNKRNYGIDLLKITAMLMICVLHTLGYGGILKSCQQGDTNWYLGWLLEIVCFVAVNCYAMVTGYLNFGRRAKLSNIIMLCLQAIFYSVVITFLFLIFKNNVSITAIVKAFFPATANTWWYFTCYVFLFLFIPILNAAVEKLNRLQLKAVIALSVLMPFIASVLRNDGFGLVKGYSPIWLMIMYITGAYIKKYGLGIKKPKHSFLLFLSVSAFTFLSKILITYLTKRVLGYVTYADILIEYTSPTIVLASILLFVSFLKFEGSKILMRLHIEKISALTFGVYLIHTHPLIFDNIIFERFASYADITNPIFYVLKIILTAVLIFVICACVEFIRVLLFKVLKVNAAVNKAVSKISCVFDKKIYN